MPCAARVQDAKPCVRQPDTCVRWRKDAFIVGSAVAQRIAHAYRRRTHVASGMGRDDAGYATHAVAVFFDGINFI